MSQYKVFTLPVLGFDDAEQQLNEFLQRHKIINIDRQFVANGDNSLWCFCIQYQAGNPPASNAKSKIDYKDILSETEFAQFAALRELRKQLAEQEGIPVFGVFTNEQLAKMVQNQVSNLAQLKAIDGIGENRVTRYGDAMLRKLAALRNNYNA